MGNIWVLSSICCKTMAKRFWRNRLRSKVIMGATLFDLRSITWVTKSSILNPGEVSLPCTFLLPVRAWSRALWLYSSGRAPDPIRFGPGPFSGWQFPWPLDSTVPLPVESDPFRPLPLPSSFSCFIASCKSSCSFSSFTPLVASWRAGPRPLWYWKSYQCSYHYSSVAPQQVQVNESKLPDCWGLIPSLLTPSWNRWHVTSTYAGSTQTMPKQLGVPQYPIRPQETPLLGQCLPGLDTSSGVSYGP